MSKDETKDQREAIINGLRVHAEELRRLAHIIAIAPLDMFNVEELQKLGRDMESLASVEGGPVNNNPAGWVHSITHASDDFNDWDTHYDFSGVIH